MAGIKSEGILIGIWTGFDNFGTHGSIKVAKEYQGKRKTYLLKVLGSAQVENAEKNWQLCKGQEIKFTYGLSEMGVYNGREYESKPVVFGINNAGGEPIPEPVTEKPAEPHQSDMANSDEEDDLPF